MYVDHPTVIGYPCWDKRWQGLVARLGWSARGLESSARCDMGSGRIQTWFFPFQAATMNELQKDYCSFQIFREVTLWFMLKVSSHPVPSSQVRSFQQSGRGLVSPRKMVRRMQRHLDREQVAGWRLMIAGWWFGTWLLCFHSVGNVIIPTDELIFFRGVGIPPTTIWVCLKMQYT